jgi:putative transposase
MEAEMSSHIGYEKHAPEGRNKQNSRNGHSRKKVISSDDEIDLSVPRDRNGDFEPQIVQKHQRRFDGFDEKIISMYSHGMTTRDIQYHLKDMYNVEVSPSLISEVTDAIIDDVRAWQNRPLEGVYLILFLDCVVVKCREDKQIRNKSVFLALAVTMEGKKELLGMWMADNEGAKFWLHVVTELKNRGVQDIFIACVDGLKGFPEAINSVFPQTKVQLCIVHMVRNSLKYVPHKNKKAVSADLKKVYNAATVDEAKTMLEDFASKWDTQYPTISKQWQNNWENVIPFFDFPQDILKAIYTTNAIESINRSLRKALKTRGALPNDEAVFKLLYLALRNISRRWTLPIRDWKAALNQFAIHFEGRFEL